MEFQMIHLLFLMFCITSIATFSAEPVQPPRPPNPDGTPAAGNSKPAVPAKPKEDKWGKVDIDAKIKSTDENERKTGIAAIRAHLVGENQFTKNDLVTGAQIFRYHWAGDLMKSKEYDAAADLALQAILRNAHHSDLVEALLHARIRALLAAGKNDDA